jgi:glycosyltransferase involved in cell wall biosynthesis/2-polyprenyl-3-methyl-5-hydroxy-6-metoxy-1,4-benzoquinol methylase
MNIAYILRGAGISGGQRVVHEHVKGLRDLGHDARLVMISGKTDDFWLPHTYPINGPDWLHEADIVVATSWPTAHWLNEQPVRAKKCYLVQGRESLMIDGSGDPQMVMAAELTYQLPFHFMTITDWLAEMLKREHNQPGVVKIDNGVSLDFNPDVVPKPRSKKWVVLIEGSMHNMAKDRYLMAGAVIANLPEEIRQQTEVWLFTHDQDYYNALSDVVDKVFFRPNQGEIPAIYAGADVMLKCSRFEGRPCPIVEALACGCVPVVSMGRGYDDNKNVIYRYGLEDVTAFASEYGDVAGTVGNLVEALVNEGARQKVRAEGLAHVKTLDWGRIAGELDEIYTLIHEATPWKRAQANEMVWWESYIKDELGDPPLPTLLGHRRQQLKDMLRKFGYWRDQNYGVLPAGAWLDAGSGPVSVLEGTDRCRVTAIDPLMELYAEKLTQCELGQRNNATYQVGATEALNGDTYTGVWCVNVLDHTDNWQAGLTNLCEAVEEGGVLFLMTHCRPPNRLDRHHVQSYSAADVLRVIENILELDFVDVRKQLGTHLDELWVRAKRGA